MNKRVRIVVILGCISFLTGCGNISENDTKEMSETAKDVVQEVADQTANIVDSEDEHVLMVKKGHPESYPDTTYQQAFESFFSYPTWKYFTGTRNSSDEDGDGKPDSVEEDVDIVEFTGYCMYQNVEVKALIQFTLNKEAGTFTATYLSFNDVPQNNLTLWAVVEAAFEGDDTESTQEEVKTELTEEQQQDTQDIAVDEEQLQEFIELICSYSDPPSECSEEELQEYFKREYIEWKNGKGDSKIYVGEDGHLKLEPSAEMLQGTWWDTTSQRCYMDIQYKDDKYYIDINWSSGASENTHWSFVGEYSYEFDAIYCEGNCVEETYTEDGGYQENYVYTNGTSIIYLDTDSKLYWHDYVQNQGEGCVFEKG